MRFEQNHASQQCLDCIEEPDYNIAVPVLSQPGPGSGIFRVPVRQAIPCCRPAADPYFCLNECNGGAFRQKSAIGEGPILSESSLYLLISTTIIFADFRCILTSTYSR